MKSENSKRETELLNGIISIIKESIPDSNIFLFGSRAKNQNTKGSDFDIAIDSSKPEKEIEIKIYDSIEKISGLYSIDIVYLKDIEDDFRDIILQTGLLIYESGN